MQALDLAPDTRKICFFLVQNFVNVLHRHSLPIAGIPLPEGYPFIYLLLLKTRIEALLQKLNGPEVPTAHLGR